MADRAAWVRGLIEKRWQKRVAHIRAIAEEAATSPLPPEATLGRRILEALDGIDPSPMVFVSRADLDLVMNHAGDPATVAEYPAAAHRIQDALGGRHG